MIPTHIPNIKDKYLLDYYKLYKTKLLVLINKQFDQEDIHNKSNYYSILNQYIYAFQYVILIYNEYSLGLKTDWDYYIEKYSITTNQKKLQCSGVDLDKIFEIFEIPYTDIYIPVQIAVNNLVGGAVTSTDTDYDTLNITLPMVSRCTTNLETICN